MIHNRRLFYKYTTADTTLKIIQNRTLKYSSPVLFNDPFDVQTKVDYGFSQTEYDKAFREELYRFVQSNEEPVCVNSDTYFEALMLLRRLNRVSPIMPIEVLEDQCLSFLEESKALVEEEIKRLNLWFQLVVKASRIFCVAEEHDNLLMWAHYAKDHTGVVLEFECLPEWDFPLCAARMVKYVDKPPILAELDQFIKSQTGQGPPLNHDDLFNDLFLSKSLHWTYEKEWRIFIPPYDMENPTIPRDKEGNEKLYELMTLHPQELCAVYFGCRIDPNDRKKIEECLVGDFEHVKRYDAIRNQRQYRLDFLARNE
jgi:hypothetical protein